MHDLAGQDFLLPTKESRGWLAERGRGDIDHVLLTALDLQAPSPRGRTSTSGSTTPRSTASACATHLQGEALAVFMGFGTAETGCRW